MDDFITPPHFQSLHQGTLDEADNSASTTQRRQQQDPLFFLGARGSGVGFHRHGEAWNAVIFGEAKLFPVVWGVV